ncbi:YbbR domain-containing protein [Butyrivibrio hungatei DSM 14810]|uniref:YbbR domain-containing protein n=1 Tax=Butyrivibrio hungatei DSM 14810 TaxID=1121132 RepID=A0A1M7SWD0_9FIRM|nr:CdaR family protein [Butyrivibrio hungatei]SHN62823.1 YbbR domain-containing protein [Butyrivibrio hungatei DSM 14810]
MKKITSNWGLKLASLIFAIIIWFLVTNINDPVISVRYTNVPVTLKNTNLITDQGQVYTILDGSDTISSVTIYAPRSIIDSLSQNNVVATADVQDLSSLNTVTINVTTNKYSDKIQKIVTSTDVVKLSVERKASKTLALTATTSGTLSDGYIIGDVTTEQNMIRINGPESVIQNIQSAEVDVDVTGFTSNIGTDADIILYDADGNPVDSSQVSMNIKSVRVNVSIYGTKYVPLNYVVTGEPANGYILTGKIDSNPSEVLIAGRSSVISSVNEITIKDDGLNVTGLSKNLNYTVDVSKYLPSGVTFGDPDYHGTAAVVVHIGSVSEETYDVSTKNVTVSGEVDGFDINIDDSEHDTVSLTLQGLKSELDAISAGSLEGTVDIDEILESNGLTEMTEGTYTAQVEWNLPEGVKEKAPVSVYVKVEKNN